MTAKSPDSREFLSSWLGRLYIAAVVVGSLAFVVWLFTFIGIGGYTWRTGATVYKARLSAPDRLALSVDSACNKNSEVSRLVETDVDVLVEVVADATPFLLGLECGGGVRVQLQEPLADRDVVDKRTGKVVRDASSHTEVSVDEASLDSPNRLLLHVSTCDENPEVSHLVETNVDVQVKVVADAPPFVYGKDCRDRVAIQLQEPLGDRDVVDARTGKVVRLQAKAADDGAAEMPDVPAPKIGDAPNEAELENLRFVANQKGISLQAAIERYGWRDNFSLAAAQIEEAVPTAFAGAEIVDDNSAWIAFNADAPQVALDILNIFRKAHSGVSVQVRENVGITQEERSEAIPIVHYAIYGAPEVREAVTSFNSETGRIESVVVLESGVPESVIEDLKAVAEAKLIEAMRADILDSIGVSVVRSGLDDGNRRERTGVNVQVALLSAPDRLDLIVNSCNQNPEMTLLRETDVDVQVEVVADLAPLLSVQYCQDSVEIQLQEPLGDRDVVDLHTGEVVRVRSRLEP